MEIFREVSSREPERAPSARRKSSVGKNQAAIEKHCAPLNDIRRPTFPSKPPTPAGVPPRDESPGAEHGPRRKNIHDVNVKAASYHIEIIF